MATLIISDLHLDSSQPEIVATFCDFIATQATQADALYILGDLFEYWIGDDHTTIHSQAVITSLNQLAATGVPIYFMHGNRDFLLGQQFADQANCQLLTDPSVVELYGTKVLLMHGDTLCTDDEDYLRFRAKVRDHDYQQRFLRRPLWLRKIIAYLMRTISKIRIRFKTANIMDVTPTAVTEAMKNHRVNILIHGHTHRPAIHEFIIDQQSVKRIVLSAWHSHGNVLICKPNAEFILKDFPLIPLGDNHAKSSIHY